MRLIDADNLTAIVNSATILSDRFKDVFCKLVDGEPTADAVPVVHGQWISADDGLMCSACSKYADDKIYIDYAGYTADDFPLTLCPNCGARMDADESEVK